ncbi:hypothetical protein [Aquimarina longa]|uniref:hypothetical protein n=1 Tax=Aquimarina longa TaxID=1080221 RepID=UPI0011DF11D9|nr:hypothetical protein [Aquimarina longa]
MLLMFLLISTISCNNIDSKICIENVIVHSNREFPGFDTIVFRIKSDEMIEKIKTSEIDRVLFIKNIDTIDNIGYIKNQIDKNKISFFYRTTEFIEFKDSISIKKEFLELKKVIFLMKDQSKFAVYNCKK